MNILQRARNFFSRSIPLSVLLGLGDSGASRRGWQYLDYAREGYLRNPVVSGCIRQKMDAAGAVGFGLAWKGEALEPGNEGRWAPLAKLLKRPNPNQSMDELVHKFVLHMDLGGSAPMLGINTGLVGDRVHTKPELYLKRPDTVTVKLNADGTLAGYTYKEANRPPVNFTTEEMMVWRYPHPEDDYTGLSPLAPIEEVIDAHSASISWNRSLLRNSGRLSGLLLLKGAHTLPDAERLKIQQDVKERLAGSKNAGAIEVAAAEGMEYKQMGGSAQDIDWLNGKRDNMREICAALRVPSKLLNDPESGTYANYAEARRALYTDTVLPLMDYFAAELNEWLLPKYDPTGGLSIVLLTDHIDALREDANQTYERMSKPVSQRTLTINEQRKALGYGDLPDGDVLLAPAAPAFGQASFRDARWVGSKAGLSLTQRYAAAVAKPLRTFTEDVLGALEREGVLEQYRQYLIVKYPGLRRDAQQDALHLKQIAARVLEQFTLDLDPVAEEYTRKIWGSSATQAFGQLGASLSWNVDNSAAVNRAVADRQNKIKGVSETQKDHILESVRTVMQDSGGSPVSPALLGDIRRIADGRTDYEAERIARTESLAVSGQAQHTVFKSNGVPNKRWVHSGSDYPRHMYLDGEEVGIDEPFSNGLMYPGDPDGPAEEVVNCMCALAPAGFAEPDEWVTE